MRARGLVVLVGMLVAVAGCGGDADGLHPAASPTTTVDPSTETTTTSPTGTAAEPVGPAVDLRGVEVAVEPTGEVIHGSLVTPDGRTRTYRLYLPTQRADDAPLVLALHGGTGNGDQLAQTSGYDGLAEANGFVVAYPDGTPTALGPRRLVWNAGGCCAAAARDGSDDVAFLGALIDALAEDHDLDPTKVLGVGHSNGAMMAMRLACEAADRVAAIAVQAGTVFVDGCAPSRPVSVLDLHGSADRNLPVDGGVGEDSAAGADFPPVRDGLAAFARAAGCEGADHPTVRETDQSGIAAESWGPCPGGIDVELVLVDGAGHAWMGHPAPSGRGDEPYPGLDASLVTWAFLAAHRG